MSSSSPYQRQPFLRYSPNSKSKRSRSDWERRWRYYYWRFARLRGTPESIARGLAAGVFTGLFPVFGLQIVAAVALATLVRGNKVMAAIGTWISNPLTSLPLYALNFQVGQWVLGSQETFDPHSIESFKDLRTFGAEFLTNLLVGSSVMGLICAISTYFVTVHLIQRARTKQRLTRQLSIKNRGLRGRRQD